MNKQAWGLILVISGALLATACASTGVTSYTGREVAAPTQKMIEEAKTTADHEALAAYYDRDEQYGDLGNDQIHDCHETRCL